MDSAFGKQPLYPVAKVEPEMGSSDTQDVVATVELTPLQQVKTSPLIAVITSIPQPPNTPIHLQEKLGSKCCGCCCDMRRAVIIVDAIFIGIGIFIVLARAGADDLMQDAYDDDQFVEEASSLIDEYYINRSIFLGISILTAFLAQVGSVYFNVWLVGLHTVWMVVDYISFLILATRLYAELEDTYASIPKEPMSPLPGFIFNGLLTGIFMYPHLGFITEVRAGILTKDTYPREEFSCCCQRRYY